MTKPKDVSFHVAGQTCRGWLFLPAAGGNEKPPMIVMGHGLGAVKEMGLEFYAERFIAQGYACLVFDYRHFGTSDGEPRQLLDIHKQLQDWQAAIDFARTLPEVDGKRLVLWGTSFGGGHVLVTGSRNPDVAAIIAQCPFTDGLASALAIDVKTSIKLTAVAIADALGSLIGRAPIYVPLAAAPGVLAMMNTADAESGYLALVPKGLSFRNEVAARVVLRIIGHVPGRIARNSKIPTLLCVCSTDSVAPAKATLRHAQKMPAAQVKLYPVGHFDIYSGEGFAQVIADQIAFLRRTVPVSHA